MAAESDSERSFLEQLISSRNRDLSFFLPFVLGFSASPRRESEETDQETEERRTTTTTTTTQDRIILINPLTQGMIVIEGSAILEALLREAASKQGPPPASKVAIEAMPRVVITEEEVAEDEECSICLEGWEISGEAREMPCKHRYHSSCIEKWLGIHGSCPVCRFKMPVDEKECKKRSSSSSSTRSGGDGGEDERRRSQREIWVSFSLISNRRESAAGNESDSGDVSSNGEENS